MNKPQPKEIIKIDEVVPEAQAKIDEILAKHKPHFKLTPQIRRDAEMKALNEPEIENLND